MLQVCSNNVLQTDSVVATQAVLDHLKGQEDSVIAGGPEDFICSPRELTRELARIDLLRVQLGSQAVVTRSIGSNVISNASASAKHISATVRRLDLEQVSVQSTLDVVELVAELKACVLGVTGSMGAPQDWETAAGYLHRASKIPQHILTGTFAEEIVPTAEVPDPPSVTLENAAESLRGLFLREFEKAAQEGNGGKVTRFFKLFPLIGKPEVGLDVYGRYVCQGVASRVRANMNMGTGGAQSKDTFFYAGALTKLFEHIAQIIEHHGGLVEQHYGVGRMVKVIERLQMEADVQGSILLDTWSDERDIDRRLTDIRSYAFTFLVQSFLPAPTTRSTTPRAGSPATKASTIGNQGLGKDVSDMKEVDSLVSEIALMLGRWSLYMSFIASKCRDPGAQTRHLEVPSLLVNSTLRRTVYDRLITPFNTMTTFFLRRSIEKAFQLDEQPSGLTLDHKKLLHTDPPFITSAVDDVMYIVNQIVERSLATSQKAVITSVIPTVSRVLGSDFIGMIQRKMRDECYPRAAVQGALPPERTTIAFLVLINNLDVAVDYTGRIVDSRTGNSPSRGSVGSPAISLASLFTLDHEAVLVLNALKSLKSSFEVKANELIGEGIFVVFKNIVKPRLRPILADAFRDVDYQMTQEELEEESATVETEGKLGENSESTVQDGFQRGWELLTKPVVRLLTERNFEKLLSLMTLYLGEVLEKRVWSYYGRLDDFGAVRLERDIASIVSIVVRGGKYGLREAFTRCTQICMIMNMEEEEWDEAEKSASAAEDDGIEWQLDFDERSRARGMVRTKGVKAL